MAHRWSLVDMAQDVVSWRCDRCALECTTRPTAITPRSGHDGIQIGGRFADRMPPCGDERPRRYPHRHVWQIRASANDRAHWTCQRCGIEAETSIAVTHPSGNNNGLRYMRRPGDPWSRLTARLPPCEVADANR